ncbi:hypothetical protein [Companilactobacillus hulinensis]|uniref:hypothetical protein n=1 Tax=Companilactobacillus hulinensis TaxID=2486007 RepID=UPI000F766BC9|nr:hypothetical protein [Companilactobacillus hulinensis]
MENKTSRREYKKTSLYEKSNEKKIFTNGVYPEMTSTTKSEYLARVIQSKIDSGKVIEIKSKKDLENWLSIDD